MAEFAEPGQVFFRCVYADNLRNGCDVYQCLQDNVSNRFQIASNIDHTAFLFYDTETCETISISDPIIEPCNGKDKRNKWSYFLFGGIILANAIYNY
jgi:hypothetical protein